MGEHMHHAHTSWVLWGIQLGIKEKGGASKDLPIQDQKTLKTLPTPANRGGQQGGLEARRGQGGWRLVTLGDIKRY